MSVSNQMFGRIWGIKSPVRRRIALCLAIPLAGLPLRLLNIALMPFVVIALVLAGTAIGFWHACVEVVQAAGASWANERAAWMLLLRASPKIWRTTFEDRPVSRILPKGRP